jgi:hypothetical protein
MGRLTSLRSLVALKSRRFNGRALIFSYLLLLFLQSRREHLARLSDIIIHVNSSHVRMQKKSFAIYAVVEGKHSYWWWYWHKINDLALRAEQGLLKWPSIHVVLQNPS